MIQLQNIKDGVEYSPHFNKRRQPGAAIYLSLSIKKSI
jgi:hypothetical protein